MLFLFLIALLIYPNARLAKKKGRNPFVWGFLTLVAFFLSYLLLGSIYIGIIYKGAYTQQAMVAYVMNDSLTIFMLFMLGLAGVLLVRFMLERGKGRDAGQT